MLQKIIDRLQSLIDCRDQNLRKELIIEITALNKGQSENIQRDVRRCIWHSGNCRPKTIEALDRIKQEAALDAGKISSW